MLFVDTSGAYCGIGAEERGQGQAIAENLLEMSTLCVPIVSVMIGEGGSGGALALAAGDRVWMLENAVYSVISPEGCASILWKDAAKAGEAAACLKLTALIGDRLYCLIDGKTVLQPQRISRERRAQLRRALLLSTPQERVEKGFHEIYLHNGIRVTIYAGDRTKPEQEVMVFRKYLFKDLSFENLAELGTIPREAIPLFRDMIRIGFNILIGGPVRSGKTTFLQIWQREEDPSRR